MLVQEIHAQEQFHLSLEDDCSGARIFGNHAITVSELLPFASLLVSALASDGSNHSQQAAMNDRGRATLVYECGYVSRTAVLLIPHCVYYQQRRIPWLVATPSRWRASCQPPS